MLAKRDAVVTAKTAHKDLSREITKQEDEIEAVRAREDRDRKLLNDGNVAARQITDLEHELETLSRRQAALEDDLLELMERREALELDIKHAHVETEQGRGDAGRRAAAPRRSALADLDTAADPQGRRPREAGASLPRRPARALRTRVRAQKGIGAALLRAPPLRRLPDRAGPRRHRRDQATRPPTRWCAARSAAPILVRTAESGL